MSKNNVAGAESNATLDDEDGDDTETVALGIGITVELDSDAVDDGNALVFGEREALEAAVDGDSGEDDARSAITGEEREALADAGVDPDAVRAKAYAYRSLLEEGVDQTVADALRRRFSLSWSFAGDDGDLEHRSTEVRGLGEAEREWIAASDGDWQAFEYDHSPIERIERDRPDERPWPEPTPTTAVTGVGPDDADTLAEAGVRSAERLATVDAFTLARALDLDVVHVRTWRHNARELLE